MSKKKKGGAPGFGLHPKGGYVYGGTRQPGQTVRTPGYRLAVGLQRALRARPPADVIVYDAQGRVVRVLDGATKQPRAQGK